MGRGVVVVRVLRIHEQGSFSALSREALVGPGLALVWSPSTASF